MEQPEVALWRAVVQQAVTDANIAEIPLPEYPAESDRYELELHPREDGSIEFKLVDLYQRVATQRDKIKEELRERDKARDWLRSAGLDFKLVCQMADIEPEYVTRKFAEPNNHERLA